MFNPFLKRIGEILDANDLSQLLTRQVAEGLYVEYKREFPSKNIKIARSLASLANSYGGWYFVGIEASKPDNLPRDLVGIDLSQFPDPISKIRDTAKGNIDPFPAFFLQLIDVSPGRSVLVVRIPDEQDKPFMTADGRLYRRDADSSEPVFEKDRYTIDQMYREGRRFSKVFADIRTEQSKSSLKTPTLDLLIMPYPNIVSRSDTLPVENVQEFLDRTKEKFKVRFFGVESETNMPMNTGYASGESLVFRQVSPESGHYWGTSMEFAFRDGAATFQMPLCFIGTEDARETSNAEVAAVLDSLVSPLNLLDLGTSLLMIANLVTFYLHWLGDQPSITQFRFALTLKGIGNSLPFFDDVEWARHVAAFGLPICLRKQIKVPSRGWYVWRPELDLSLWEFIAVFVAYAVGVPESVLGHSLAASVQRALQSGGKLMSKWESH